MCASPRACDGESLLCGPDTGRQHQQQGCSRTGAHDRQFKSYVSTMSDKCDRRKEKKKKEWESDSASQSHNIDTSQIEIVQTGLLQRHERDANQHGTNVGLSLDVQDEDMVT